MTKAQFPSLTKGQQLAEIYEALGGTMNKRFFEALSEDQQMAEIWEEIGAPGAGGGLPDQTGNGGKVLRTNGTDATWSFDGSTLTELDATELIGIVPDTSFPAILPVASAANLTNLDAADLTGNIAVARMATALTAPGPIGAVTPGTVAATTLSTTGQLTVGAGGINVTGTSSITGILTATGVVGAYYVTIGATLLQEDAANILAQQNGTAAQKMRWYYTWATAGADYQRAAINTGADYVELAAETGGTGADDLDVRITPSGTGALRIGVHTAVVAEVVTGYITIKDAAGNSRKLAVIS